MVISEVIGNDFIDDALIKKIKELPAHHKEYVTQNRLDLLAYKFYGSCDYWWAIALYNDILDPIDFKDEVSEIYAPSKEDLNNVIINYQVKGVSA